MTGGRCEDLALHHAACAELVSLLAELANQGNGGRDAFEVVHDVVGVQQVMGHSASQPRSLRSVAASSSWRNSRLGSIFCGVFVFQARRGPHSNLG
jgi:hypothetical protein